MISFSLSQGQSSIMCPTKPVEYLSTYEYLYYHVLARIFMLCSLVVPKKRCDFESNLNEKFIN